MHQRQSKGYSLDPKRRAQLQAADKLQARAAELAQKQEAVVQRVAKQMVDLVPVVEPTTYMRAKGIEPMPGVLTDPCSARCCSAGEVLDAQVISELCSSRRPHIRR